MLSCDLVIATQSLRCLHVWVWMALDAPFSLHHLSKFLIIRDWNGQPLIVLFKFSEGHLHEPHIPGTHWTSLALVLEWRHKGREYFSLGALPCNNREAFDHAELINDITIRAQTIKQWAITRASYSFIFDFGKFHEGNRRAQPMKAWLVAIKEFVQSQRGAVENWNTRSYKARVMLWEPTQIQMVWARVCEQNVKDKWAKMEQTQGSNLRGETNKNERKQGVIKKWLWEESMYFSFFFFWEQRGHDDRAIHYKCTRI